MVFGRNIGDGGGFVIMSDLILNRTLSRMYTHHQDKCILAQGWIIDYFLDIIIFIEYVWIHESFCFGWRCAK